MKTTIIITTILLLFSLMITSSKNISQHANNNEFMHLLNEPVSMFSDIIPGLCPIMVELPDQSEEYLLSRKTIRHIYSLVTEEEEK